MDTHKKKEVILKQKQKWIEITPYGIVGGMIAEASTMLFKRKKGEGHFLVWFSELQSRIAIDQNLNKERVFDFVIKILSSKNMLPERCYFTHKEQGRDVVKVFFENMKEPMKFYADEILSFCMITSCRFFSSPEFFENKSHGEVPKRFRKLPLGSKPTHLH